MQKTPLSVTALFSVNLLTFLTNLTESSSDQSHYEVPASPSILVVGRFVIVSR
jgi:hypothetical protein